MGVLCQDEAGEPHGLDEVWWTRIPSGTARSSSCTTPRSTKTKHLELRTKPSDLAQTDDGACEGCEGEVKIGAAFVARGKAPEPGQPGERALDHPPVPPEMGAALHRTAGDAGSDPTGPALLAAAAVVVTLVSVQLRWSLARPPTAPGPHAGHGVQGRCQHHAVVAVGTAQRQAKWRAAGIGDQMALRAGPAAVRRVGPDLRPPFLAGRLALSNAARLQSSAPAPCICSSSTRCRFAHTPAACHSPRRRQHVLPQQPSSAGTSCH